MILADDVSVWFVLILQNHFKTNGSCALALAGLAIWSGGSYTAQTFFQEDVP
jgi:hypothetical protein